MTHVRAVLVLLTAAAFAPALAAEPTGKAKRLAPADPPPAAVEVPVEPKVAIVGSCSFGAASCSDYQGAFTGVDVQGLCAKEKGTFSASACPTEKSVGTCTQRQDGSEDRILTRTYAPGTADAARKACVSKPRGIFLKGS